MTSALPSSSHMCGYIIPSTPGLGAGPSASAHLAIQNWFRKVAFAERGVLVKFEVLDNELFLNVFTPRHHSENESLPPLFLGGKTKAQRSYVIRVIQTGSYRDGFYPGHPSTRAAALFSSSATFEAKWWVASPPSSNMLIL